MTAARKVRSLLDVKRTGLTHNINEMKRAFELLARMVADKGVRVIFRGTTCATDHKTVYLPELALLERKDMTQKEVEEAQGFLDAVRGFLFHEVAHILFTDDAVFQKGAKEGPLYKHAMNAVEDVRIEKRMTDTWRGAGVSLRQMNEWMLRKMQAQIAKEPIIGKVIVGIAWVARTGEDHWFFKELDEPTKALLRKFAPEIRAARNIESTEEAMRLGQRIVKKLKSMAEEEEKKQDKGGQPQKQKGKKSKAPSFEPGTGDPEDEEEDADEGEEGDEEEAGDEEERDDNNEKPKRKSKKKEKDDGEADEADEEGDDEAAGGGDEEGDDAGGGEDDSDDESSEDDDGDAAAGSAGADDDEGGEEDSGEGGAGDDGGGAEDEPSSSDEAGDSGPDSTGDEDALDKALDQLKDELDQLNTTANQVEQMTDKARQLGSFITPPGNNDKYLVYTTEYDKADPAPSQPAAKYKEMMEDARKHFGILKRNLANLLKARANVMTISELEEGELDSAMLYRLASGLGDKVFKEDIEHLDTQVAVVLLVNESGSMNAGAGYNQTRVSLARITAALMGEVLDSLGIPFGCYGHTTGANATEVFWQANEQDQETFTRWGSTQVYVYKDFDESFAATKYRIPSMMARNNTHDAEALIFAANKLLLQKGVQRRIIMTLDDGRPEPNTPYPHHNGYDSKTGQYNSKSASQKAVQNIYTMPSKHQDYVRAVVKTLAAMNIEVLGMGMATEDVKFFYEKSLSVRDVAAFPAIALKELRKLLLAPAKK